jgi:hypothetical protein
MKNIRKVATRGEKIFKNQNNILLLRFYLLTSMASFLSSHWISNGKMLTSVI